MSQDLRNEIQDSFVLRSYHKLSKLADYIHYFKSAALVFFFLGLIETVVFGEMDKILIYAGFIIWAPGILFAIVMGVLHFSTGFKIRKLAEKYGLDKLEVQLHIENVLE